MPVLHAVGAARRPSAPRGPPAVHGLAHVRAVLLLDGLSFAARAVVDGGGVVAEPGALARSAAALLVALRPFGPISPLAWH